MNRARAQRARQFLFAAALVLLCLPEPARSELLSYLGTDTLTTNAEGGSARPEVVATSDRVFALYLGNITGGANRTFSLKIYDAGLDTVIAARVIVQPTADYGAPTDIRVAADGAHLYAFYETGKSTPQGSETFLWGAKYTLDDNFDRVAYTATPIASSRSMSELPEGGELLNDPAPLVGSETVFAVTRIKYSLRMAGRTVYRVREFRKSDLALLSQFDLELTDAPGVDGRARVASLIRRSGGYLIALPTTVSDAGIIENADLSAISDVAVVRLDGNWTFDPQTGVTIISAEPNDHESYVSGLATDGSRFFVTYVQVAAGEMRAVLKAFDLDFHLLEGVIVKRIPGPPGGGEIRPSLAVAGWRILSGQSSGQAIGLGNAEISTYEVAATAAAEGRRSAPAQVSLGQNRPNPFHAATTIDFVLPESMNATLRVFDASGRAVATLIDGELGAGPHAVAFDPRRSPAGDLPSGVYFFRLSACPAGAGDERGAAVRKRMLLVR